MRIYRILPYLIGIPAITFLYLLGFALIRGSDYRWDPNLNPFVRYFILFIVPVFYWPTGLLIRILPSLRNTMAGEYLAILIPGCLWGFAIVWVWQRIIKLRNK